MHDIVRVPATGEPPRRSVEQRPPRRERRPAEGERSLPQVPGDVVPDAEEREHPGRLDVRV
jgi:hypothetical protein